ncbi:MAG: methylmalonyl-CoA carboxyltransferase, partial [Alphaproteobacteria bacterium]|nr:methylmalonyl-CoA carboxyltransferase [Alphaproteobacteria bacterium]
MTDDLTNLDSLLEDLEERRAKARGMGGPEKLEKRRKQGVLNARERVERLVDKGSFIETGLLGTSGVYLQDRDKTPADGKVTGFGRIDGRDVAVSVN